MTDTTVTGETQTPAKPKAVTRIIRELIATNPAISNSDIKKQLEGMGHGDAKPSTISTLRADSLAFLAVLRDLGMLREPRRQRGGGSAEA